MTAQATLGRVIVCICACSFVLGAAEARATDPPNAGNEGSVLFRDKVAPILASKCLGCHSSEKKKGGLDLTRRAFALVGGESGEPAVAPRMPDDSALIAKLEAGEMPPPPNPPLERQTIVDFRKWIELGAEYGKEPLAASLAGPLWSLEPLVRPTPPTPKKSDWARNPIDAFILAKLEVNGLVPALEADRFTLVRRASLDLTGLPPSPEEIDQFIKDSDPLAYEHLIDRLLASPHYGERWGRHWLDIVRFGESQGYETNIIRPTAWPYRDYVIRAFNRDLPFSQFVRDQLAADTLPDADGLTRAATGFLVGGTHDIVGNQTPEGMRQQRMDDLDDMIAATSTAFLGLSVQCARCHDHKFDPIAQRDYYGMQAIFAGVQHAEREIPLIEDTQRLADRKRLSKELAMVERVLDEMEEIADPLASIPRRGPVNAGRNVDRFEPVAAKSVRFTIQATSDGIEPCLDELEVIGIEEGRRNLAEQALGAKAWASSNYPNNPIHQIEHLNDAKLGNSQSWISNEPGKGWARIDFPAPVRIDRVVWGRDRTGGFRDRLAVAYVIEILNEMGEWKVVASSADRAGFSSGTVVNEPPASKYKERPAFVELRDKLRAQFAVANQAQMVYAGTFSTPGETHILLRGDPMHPGEAVTPSAIAKVSPPWALEANAKESDRRLALASWIADPRNPLPSRLMVNRVWQYHFGEAIAPTSADFGNQGAPPTHPELLDWLANEYTRNGGRIKPLHRLIMLSSTYRQASARNEKAAALDQGNRWLWRYPSRRLEAEAIRDAILFSSGELDLRIGGPSYTVWQANSNYVAVYNSLRDLSAGAFRRMVYQLRPRGQTDRTFGVFDCPDASQPVPRRMVSTTAPQALALWNSEFMIARAAALAERVRREAGEDRQAQVKRAFLLTMGREPSDRERDAGAVLVGKQGAAALARALFNANEFLTLP